MVPGSATQEKPPGDRVVEDFQRAHREGLQKSFAGAEAGSDPGERESGPRREYRSSRSLGHVGISQSRWLEKGGLVEDGVGCSPCGHSRD